MVTRIKVNCVDQDLKVAEAPLIATGGLGETIVEFTFCELWNGYSKTAIFYRNKNNVYYALLNEDNTCIIPQEVLLDDGVMYFGVFGDNAEGVTRTSKIIKYLVEKGAITSDLKPSEPTPSVYEQLLSKYQSVLETAQETYEAEQTFEENITKKQNTFESNLTNRQNTYEQSITTQLNEAMNQVPTIAKEEAEKVANSKVDKTSIADNLTTDDNTKVLSAKQGKELKDGLDNHNHDDKYYTQSQVDELIANAGSSPVPMSVVNKEVPITEGGIYVLYGQAYTSSAYNSSAYVSSIMLIPPLSEAPTSIISYNATGSNGHVITFTFTKSTSKIKMSGIDTDGTMKGIIKCYQLAKF